MAFPEGWPPRPCEGRRSIRFFLSGTGTANFSDNAYLFSDQTSANTIVPMPYVAPGSKATVALGSLTAGAQPMGGGQNINDANYTAAAAYQAVPHPMIWANTIHLWNTGSSNLEFSFDGINVHGVIPGGKDAIYRNRHEAGIAVRGNTVPFLIEAW